MAGEHKSFDKNETAESERLQNTLISAGIGTWELDPERQLIQWDDQCQALFGFSGGQQLPINCYWLLFILTLNIW